MEAYITVKPVFNLTISKDIALLLSKKSTEHYDLTCINASKPGGFIYGWLNCIEHDTTCKASFRELDLTLKICERSDYYSNEDKKLIEEYRGFVGRALKGSNAFIMELPKIIIK